MQQQYRYAMDMLAEAMYWEHKALSCSSLGVVPLTLAFDNVAELEAKQMEVDTQWAASQEQKGRLEQVFLKTVSSVGKHIHDSYTC
jgi:hypothetical protein